MIDESPTGNIFKGNEIGMSKRWMLSHVYCNTIHKNEDIEAI